MGHWVRLGAGWRGWLFRRAPIRAWNGVLPRGQTLPDHEWPGRHRAVLGLLEAHIVALPVFLLVQGFSAWSSVLAILPLLGAAVVARTPPVGRRGRSIAAGLGLLAASAVLVYGWHGQPAAYFHLFVMIVLLSLYEDWLPFGLAVAYVVLEHGVLGTLFSRDVSVHGGNPWLWGGLYGIFVLALGAACIVVWRLNESARARAAEAAQTERRTSGPFQAAFDSGLAGMALQSATGRFLQVNRALCAMLGYSESELLELRFLDITHPDDRALGEEQLRDVQESRLDLYETEKRYVHRDGTTVWVRVGVTGVRDDHGRLEYFVVQANDITERKLYEAKLAHDALHDSLTGLPNRALFVERLSHLLQRLRRHGEPLAVLFVDLDRFKLVNDTLGHAAGDAVLIESARRLQSAVREEDMVARFGGDEFTVLCEGATEDEARQLAARMLQVFDEPFRHGEIEFNLSASVGVRTSGRADTDAEALLRESDQALYVAKENGRGCFAVFDGAASAPWTAATLAEDGRPAVPRVHPRALQAPAQLAPAGAGAARR